MVNQKKQWGAVKMPDQPVFVSKAFPEEKLAPKSSKEPIVETANAVSYLGVELPKAKGGNFCPKRENYNNYINEEFSLELQKKIATAWKLDQPVLIEGGTSIGKTTAVKKMCAELGYEAYYLNLNGTTDVENLMGRYIPNPDRKTSKDPEYKWVDGPVTQALRQEEGKIKVLILDEYNSANPNIIIRLHEILDELEKNGEIVLSEDASERIKIDKSKTKIAALTNPPGEGYLDRQPLDPAQLRRWVYLKAATELPKDTFSVSVDMMFHLKPEIEEIAEENFLFSNELEIPLDELKEIPGMQEILEKYKEFHFAAKELLKNRKIAQDQPQAFTFDDRMEPQRVLKFIQNFYRGDINRVWQEALRYYYVNKLEDKTDRAKLEELINAIGYVPPTESRRKTAEREKKAPDPKEEVKASKEDEEAKAKAEEEEKARLEIEKIRKEIKEIAESGKAPEGFFAEEKKEELSGELSEQIKNAREILGKKDVLGPEEIEKTFNIKLKMEDIPKIPFSKEDLEKAKKLNQFLVLRVDKAKDGAALSMEKMNDLLTKEFEKDGRGKILASIDWYKEEDFFVKETPRLSWALTNKEVIPNSTNKNYLQQTEEIINYLKKKVFGKKTMPKNFQEAVQEFAEKKGKIEKLMKENWQEAAQELENLKITGLTRQSPAEFLYDFLVYFKSNEERLMENMYTWTSGRASGGGLVVVGGAAAGGAFVSRNEPAYSNGALGVVVSRRSAMGG